MSEEPRRTSHASTWTLGVAGALVLYVLSFGPVAFVIIKMDPGFTAAARPKWWTYFYAPVIWLDDHTPLKKPLDAYGDWWVNLAERP